MMDFKGEKVGDVVMMVEEWLGWPLECLQRPKGGRKVVLGLLRCLSNQEMLVDGCWDACNIQKMEVNGLGMIVMAAGMLVAVEER
ncbi:hypothetical protein Pyn_05793 [Prunus yedoensis var. nudiflora]|uniref:Uncharacterized protein n=1 Tax=Prunus yedoensis var. nudiflora TaxID=2094558 RepID=A0A315AV00_PRUYE|nr:hypothetical protein Pyn_05793 [Prunus yedoensis var. nudiflora]